MPNEETKIKKAIKLTSRKKMSLAHKGKHHTEATKRKIGLANNWLKRSG